MTDREVIERKSSAAVNLAERTQFSQGIQRAIGVSTPPLTSLRGKTYCDTCAVLTAWLNIVTSELVMAAGEFAV